MFSVVVGVSIPFIVISDQESRKKSRKENLYADRERMIQKLEKDSTLKMKTTLDILPIKLEDNNKS